MTLSRTSRIMLGFLLLALAAFLWVNFLFNGTILDSAFLRAAPAPTPSGGQSAEAQAPSVAPIPDSRVARELEVLDLPFLVTEPPAEASEAEQAQAEAEAAEPAATARRATVNPFAPIVSRGGAQAAAPTTSAPASESRPVTEVPVPSRPRAAQASAPATPSAPKAPAPAPVTPASQASQALPRSLPGGTLGGNPELLRSAIGTDEAPSKDLSQVAALREPEESNARLEQAGEERTRNDEPQPLAQPVGQDSQAAAPRSGGRPPLQAGTSPLSRYLRDNNVRFTGSVIGPVSVGVFRSTVTSAPVVISLGQTLPDTSIVLTDLRGQQAELRLDDNSQTLTLELRR